MANGKCCTCEAAFIAPEERRSFLRLRFGRIVAWRNSRGLTRGRTRRGPASVRRPSRLVKSKPARRHAARTARFKCGQAACRAAVATWALAARVNLLTVGQTG